MHWLSRVANLVFPQRASTYVWMFLTFALFVGVSVALAGMYVTFILSSQIRDAARDTHIEEAEQIARLIEEADTPDDRARVISGVSNLKGIHVWAAENGTIIWRWTPENFVPSGRRYMDTPEVLALQPGGVYFISEQAPSSHRVTFVALKRRESGLTVGVEQAELPMHTVARDMQVMLVLGMIAAFLMALVGSWVAADKVTKPLLDISRSAKNISEGQIDAVIRVETRSAEIQDLADSVDRMSDSFREKIEALERLTRLQSEFIGNVSHEVRNPIFVVNGYLEALASPKLSSELRQRYASKARMNLQRLGNLFHDLIEIARLEYREDLLSPEIFDLGELVAEVGEMLKDKANDKGLSLSAQGPPIQILADRNRIQQVLVNLIDNAIIYSDDGTVRCRYWRRLEKVRIEVVDNGHGIEEEHLARIFERFYRVDSNRSRKSGGTGLGLSIAKQILHAHGESIHVESTSGRGTRFWFELPFAPVEAA